MRTRAFAYFCFETIIQNKTIHSFRILQRMNDRKNSTRQKQHLLNEISIIDIVKFKSEWWFLCFIDVINFINWIWHSFFFLFTSQLIYSQFFDDIIDQWIDFFFCNWINFTILWSYCRWELFFSREGRFS